MSKGSAERWNDLPGTLLGEIIATTVDAVISTDDKYRIVLFNSGAEAIFGYSAAEVTGKPLSMLLPVRLRALHDDHMARFGQSGVPSRKMAERSEILGLRSNGEEFPAEATISHVTAGTGTYFTAVLRDITARKADEREKTELLAQARRAISMRDQVLAVVSHDLRNPLSVISMVCSGLRSNPTPTAEFVGEAAATIGESTAWMNRLIGDLLDVGSIGAGRLALERRRCDPTMLVMKAVNMFEEQADSSSIALSTDLPEYLPSVLADPQRALQVLANLIGNSIKFTNAGGRIIITANAREGAVLFSVTDTGRGIGREDLGRVFDRFWHRDGESRLRGTGLGLAIARGIVEAHGGQISAESTPGRGSTFQFTIPLDDAGNPS